MTERLYYDDPFLLEFDAHVTARGELAGRQSLVLDRTAFYPESGGQMADRGQLGDARVIDVQVDAAGVVHHLLEGELPEPGTSVHGSIDRARRRVHMALHTGQHMLSRALVDVAHGETVSSRLGETSCTIDVDAREIGEQTLVRIEDLVNSIIDDDVAVRAWFPEADELSSLELRRTPKVEDHIRVVRIGDFDLTPCGGTHCTRSAQVGLLRITGVERYKGGTRLGFAAGRRARELLGGESEVLRELGRAFTCGPQEVPAAVDKLRRQLGEARESLGLVRTRLAEQTAAGLLARAAESGERHFVVQLEGAPAELLRAVGSRLTALSDAVALLAGGTSEGTPVLAVRGSDSDFDCGGFIKRAATASGGRGGGRPERAEGRLPPGVDWPALVSRLLEHLDS
jgi:alanyl-tRNA synthetase